MAKHDIWRHALAYAERGICVVPLRPFEKKPAIRNWPELATSDPDRIERWSRAFPEANLGIVPGKSKLAVFDVDLKADGLKSWSELVNDVGGLDIFDMAPTVRTPSGGWHTYFRKPETFRLGTQRGIVRGIDFFSTTGQTVAPPSRLREAGYEWRSSEYVEPPVLPEPVIRWLKAHERKVFVGSMVERIWSCDLLQTTEPIMDTTRHPVLLREGGRMRREGLSPEHICAVLKAVNLVRCKPTLDGWDIDKVIESIVGYDAGFNGKRYLEEWLPELTGSEVALAVALSARAFPDGTVRVPQSIIEESTGLDRRSSAGVAKRLESKGALLRRFGRMIEGGREATTYKLLYRSSP